MQARSIPGIFTDLLGQLTTLLRKESQLARTEMSEKVAQVATGLAVLVCGAVLLIPALVILLQAGVSALIMNHIATEPWAPLIVGGAAFILGIILAIVGVNSLKAGEAGPEQDDQSNPERCVGRQATSKEYERHLWPAARSLNTKPNKLDRNWHERSRSSANGLPLASLWIRSSIMRKPAEGANSFAI